MALQSGAMAAPEKIPVQWFNHHAQPPHHQMDERDGFLMWLRGEFAAANAIIDALCHHLRTVGDAGEYDGVVGAVQLRRCNWNPVLHMQQYFSVGDVVYTLQQVAWRRQQQQQRMGLEGGGGGRMSGGGVKEWRRGGGRGQRGFEVQNVTSGGEVYGYGQYGKDMNGGNLNFTKSGSIGNEKLEGGGEKDGVGVEEKEEKKGKKKIM